MHLPYGFVKCKVISDPVMKPSRHRHEIQYHLHANLSVRKDGASTTWDTAINVGTNDADDLLKYKFAFDYAHPILATLRAAPPGFTDLTGTSTLPALDFLRSNILNGTGPWRMSDPMDGSDTPDPAATLKRLLKSAQKLNADVYIFGRTYIEGDGIHDIHMNQGSGGNFVNDGVDNDNDHNDIWQDGAVLLDFGRPQWSAYFTTFTQQMVPTDNLGNSQDGAHRMSDADDNSLARS